METIPPELDSLIPAHLKTSLWNGEYEFLRRLAADGNIDLQHFSNKQIRAELISWAATSVKVHDAFKHPALRIAGAEISGELKFQTLRVLYPLRIERCDIPDGINLLDAQLPALLLQRTKVAKKFSADRMRVDGPLFIRTECEINTPVRMPAAQISGTVDFSNSQFNGGHEPAIVMDGATCKAGLFFQKSRINGEIRMAFSDTTGPVFFNGAHLSSEDVCLVLDGAHIRGQLSFQEGFRAKGLIHIVGAAVTNNVDFGGAAVENSKKLAIVLDRLDCGGTVFFADNCKIDGGLKFTGGTIKGDLSIKNSAFAFPNDEALGLERIDIRGALQIRDVSVEGSLMLVCVNVNADLAISGAKITKTKDFGVGLMGSRSRSLFITKNEIEGLLAFSHTHTTSFRDDPQTWPKQNQLILDCFEYDGFIGVTPTAALRLKWIELQPADFRARAHAYNQLAKVLHTQGSEQEAIEVHIARLRANRASLGRVEKIWDWLLDEILRYGYQSSRALAFFFICIVIGIFIFHAAENAHLFRAVKEPCIPFNSIIYSLDVFLPLIDMGQEKAWVLPMDDWGSIAVRSYQYIHMLVGWVLSSLAAAGLTGLIRRR